ncbi:alpha-glucosidase, partial [Streptococcus suis]
GLTPQEALDKVSAWSRDHARSPMQWDDSPKAGFTSAEPWLMLSSNYTERNVKKALSDKNSTFYLYQKLIALRHESKLIAEGHYCPVDEGNA